MSKYISHKHHYSMCMYIVFMTPHYWDKSNTELETTVTTGHSLSYVFQETKGFISQEKSKKQPF